MAIRISPRTCSSRSHHQTIDGHGLPVTHFTRRTGRPFTLVLEKTRAVFERDAAARTRWRRDLAWLTKCAAAFGAGRRAAPYERRV